MAGAKGSGCFAGVASWAKPWFQRPSEVEQTQDLINTLQKSVDNCVLRINKEVNTESALQTELHSLKRTMQSRGGQYNLAEQNRVRNLLSQIITSQQSLTRLYENLSQSQTKLNTVKSTLSTMEEMREQQLINTQHKKLLKHMTPETVAESLITSEQHNKQMNAIQSVVNVHHSNTSPYTDSLDSQVAQFFEEVASDTMASMPSVGIHRPVASPPTYGQGRYTVEFSDKSDHEPLLNAQHSWATDHL
jgi:predicted RNA binding protein with dsRBD fold (UPF0201 family)